MKRQNSFLLALAGSLTLVACNSGSNSTSGGGDQQAYGINYQSLEISYVAQNCQTITKGGTCAVQLNYNATAESAVGQTVGLELPSGYTLSPSSCPLTSMNASSCNITILASQSANTGEAQMVPVTLNGNAIPGFAGLPALFFNIGIKPAN